MAVWLGFLIIGLVLVGLRPQMPTFKWATEGEFSSTVAGSKPAVEKFIKDAEVKSDVKLLMAASALKSAIDAEDRVAIQKAAKKLGEAAKTAEDPGLKKKGGDLSKKLSEGAGALASKVFSTENILKSVYIGIALLLSIWWTMKKGTQTGERPGIRVIWERFPKFVLGFLIASFIFSFLVDPGLVKETKGILSGLRTVWFALAFTSIGLETRFTELFGMGGGRPAIAFIGAQAFNIIWTLILAYLLFGGYIFPVPAIQ